MSTLSAEPVCEGTSKKFQPTLSPIPVGGPFHRVTVDVLQLPLTAQLCCCIHGLLNQVARSILNPG